MQLCNSCSVVGGLTKGGSTVNLCALDLSKAYHHALYLKLTNRLISYELLMFWLSLRCSCVKWIDAWPLFFDFDFELGKALSYISPFLFALYLDDLTKSC